MGGKRCPAERKVEAVQQGVYRGHSVSSVVTPHDITLSRERSGLMRVYPGLHLKKQPAPTNKTTRFCFCLFTGENRFAGVNIPFWQEAIIECACSIENKGRQDEYSRNNARIKKSRRHQTRGRRFIPRDQNRQSWDATRSSALS